MLEKEVNLQKWERLRVFGLTLTAASIFFLAFSVLALSAQSSVTAGVAKTITVADPEVSYGDVVLYDAETNLYRLSQVENDPRFFGVVVEDPTLVLETENNIVPVVEAGLVPVNVTLENGAISSGDPITTSSVSGKATLALDDQLHIFGFAAESISEEEAVPIGENDVLMGTILVEVGGERLNAYILAQLEDASTVVAETDIEESQDVEPEEAPENTGALMRFGFASLVALGAIFLIFFAFITSIRQGVISVGRNPRAQSAIRSMVILNVVLAIVVVSAAIFFAISLLVVGD